MLALSSDPSSARGFRFRLATLSAKAAVAATPKPAAADARLHHTTFIVASPRPRAQQPAADGNQAYSSGPWQYDPDLAPREWTAPVAAPPATKPAVPMEKPVPAMQTKPVIISAAYPAPSREAAKETAKESAKPAPTG